MSEAPKRIRATVRPVRDGWWRNVSHEGGSREFSATYLLASEHARIVAEKDAEIARMRDALQWCSGSPDFHDGGQAREGWLKLCAPLLKGDAK